MANCDFCYDPEPTHVLPARDFQTPIPGAGSTGDWACCEVCADLIFTDQWTRLTNRVIASWEARTGLEMPDGGKAALRRLYRELRKNITGAVRKIE